MITIGQLSKTYKGNIHALRGINLEIGSQMFGLLGANGAGKTTLMRIIAGLIQPSAGKVTVMGHDVSTAKGKRLVREHLGYLPQEYGLYLNLTGAEFLDYMAILKGIRNRQARRQQVDAVLEKVRLSEVARRQMKTYSGGMRRRIGIAQALLGHPDLLIVDEPTVGLDPEERVHLRNILADMAQTSTIILSTHIVEDINQSCNDLVVILKGQILFRGSPQAMIAQVRGKVWHIVTNGERPDHGLSVVSTLQVQQGVQYRVIGEPDPVYSAVSVEPSLEDGYMWLTRHAQPMP
ncbi:MAG: ABC transporter ATP-binding protein [Anaerolineae bacterium]|nr:ABC transporter ATP-binding protein [Anaerolineae bacterium]